MNDEPVAWMYTSKDEEGEWKMFVEEEPSWVENPIPLYTRPSKQLSDEEVELTVKEWFNCHPEEKLTTEFAMPLYSVVNLCKQLLRR